MMVGALDGFGAYPGEHFAEHGPVRLADALQKQTGLGLHPFQFAQSGKWRARRARNSPVSCGFTR